LWAFALYDAFAMSTLTDATQTSTSHGLVAAAGGFFRNSRRVRVRSRESESFFWFSLNVCFCAWFSDRRGAEWRAFSGARAVGFEFEIE